MKVSIAGATVARSEGGLYEVQTEDSIAHVFDSGVSVTFPDGRIFVHGRFVARGFVTDDDGFRHPNRNYRAVVDRFIARVVSRGTIDLAYWEPVIEESWADREAYNRRCEADDRYFGA